MSLREYSDNIKPEYRSLTDNVVRDFYIPLLKEAVFYRRAVGFFSSSALVEISKGIGAMAENGGHIQIVASPNLSEEDLDAIQKGYKDRDKIIEGALLRSLSEEKTDYFSLQRLNLLSSLIADGILDIHIAFTRDQSGIGMYHEKMGIIEDSEKNRVAFSGSMNETHTGMLKNYETIDVFCDWKSDTDKERVELKDTAFNAIWNDREPNIIVKKFPEITKALIERYKKAPPNYRIDQEQFYKNIQADESAIEEPIRDKTPKGPRLPSDIELYDYQQEAISVWARENYHGIFDMATGTGKTYTGLGAIAKLSQDMDDDLAVIIVCPYQHLVEQWVEDIERFNIKPIIGYSSSPQKNWKNRLKNAVRDQKFCKETDSFFCFVCTNATFANDFVQEQISKITAPILLVVDEAHNIGARSYVELLDDRFKYRLALSATFERFNDTEGTDILYSFFGKKCIDYQLDRAIRENKLTPYEYYPVLVYLTNNELDEYGQLSDKISKCMVRSKNGMKKLSEHGKNLMLKRARIVAGAYEKIDALKREIRPYVEDHNLLIYCGSTKLSDEKLHDDETDENELRQIDAVTMILGNEMNMRVARFTAKEDIERRTEIKKRFQDGDLQAIVAIKCLDEGVNIPGIKTAFILASTTNPKEYIQRRGRVLRKAKNKNLARIYDFVTLPRPLDSVRSLTEEQMRREIPLVRNELMRIKEFGRLAIDSMNTAELIWKIQEAYMLFDDSYEGESNYV